MQLHVLHSLVSDLFSFSFSCVQRYHTPPRFGEQIPSIDSNPVATGSSDQIVLKNKTGPYATALTMGFTVNNNIIVVEDNVGGEQETMYRVHPEYYVACYRNIVLGQLVDEGVVIGPVEVKYEDGVKSMKVKATKGAGGNYRLSVVHT